MNRTVEVLTDKSAIVSRSRQIVLERIKKALESKDRFTIALAGGSTPKPLYEALAQESLPWSKIHVFWGDERYVPKSDSNSNQLMARQAWLDKVDIPEANIHPMNTSAGDADRDAQQHEAHLRDFFGTSSGEIPKFDLILLGMGDDGHTASLFPHTEVLQVSDRLVAVGNKDGQPRITFTAPLINQADCVVFLVAGANKRSALKQVFASQADDYNYPSRLIQPQGKVLWLLDQSAAAELEH